MDEISSSPPPSPRAVGARGGGGVKDNHIDRAHALSYVMSPLRGLAAQGKMVKKMKYEIYKDIHSFADNRRLCLL